MQTVRLGTFLGGILLLLTNSAFAGSLTFESVNTSIAMNGSSCTLLLACAGTLNDGIQAGGVSLYTPIGAIGGDNRALRIFKNGPLTDTLELTWSGTGSGIIPSMLPLDWEFLAVPGLGVKDPQWDVELDLNGDTVYSSGFNTLTGVLVEGQYAASTGALAGTELEDWSYSLSLSFQVDFPLESVALSVPKGDSLDLGTAADLPEPGGVWLAAMGLAATAWWRRRRRG